MKRQHQKHQNNNNKGQSSVFAKTLLTCYCPIVIAASSSNQKPPHRLYQRAYPQHESFSSDYICNHRKRVRIKQQQQQFSLNLILECRGGDSSMDDMYSYTHNQRADVLSAAATAIQPSTTYNGIDDEGINGFNSHNTHSALHTAASNNEVNVINTSSTVTNNSQLNGDSSQPNDDITESDTCTNQSLQSQPIISPSNQQLSQQRQRLMVEFDTQAIGNSDRF
eukprot:scaffold10951_cov75-Skeletonema_dohrnii-CCMP3373.AAC.3